MTIVRIRGTRVTGAIAAALLALEPELRAVLDAVAARPARGGRKGRPGAGAGHGVNDGRAA